MKISEHTSQIHPIRVVHADALQNSVDCFYEKYAHEPVIVKGLFTDNAFLQALNREKVEALFRGQTLQAYEKTTQNLVYIPATGLFDQLRSGQVLYNVVDHPLMDSPLAAAFEVPAFLQHNWFVNSGFNSDGYEKSISCTAGGNFTPLHVDAYGMQGWMYLLYGVKHWELYAPKYTPLLFDPLFKEFYHMRQDPPERFPLAPLAEKYVGTIEKGDLLFFPAAWSHQVETTEESFGIGGSVINDYQIAQSMECWLWERALNMAGELDLKQLLLNLPESRFSSEAGYQRTQAALARCAMWENRSSV